MTPTPKNLHLSKVLIHQTIEEKTYASSQTFTDFLNILKATLAVPVEDYLQNLIDGKVHSLSFTKNDPYCYFFARRFQNNILITVKDRIRIIDFTLSLNKPPSRKPPVSVPKTGRIDVNRSPITDQDPDQDNFA